MSWGRGSVAEPRLLGGGEASVAISRIEKAWLREARGGEGHTRTTFCGQKLSRAHACHEGKTVWFTTPLWTWRA